MFVTEQTGCDICEEIFEKIGDVYFFLDKKEIRSLEDRDETRSTMREIEDLVFNLKQIGQAMEDRLKEYRKAIEELGFVRKR